MENYKRNLRFAVYLFLSAAWVCMEARGQQDAVPAEQPFIGKSNEIAWQTDYSAALKKSRAENKPLLIDFHATWCGPCKQMEKMVYSDAEVTSASRAFVCVKIDIDKDNSTAYAYKVGAIPRLITLNVHGQILADRLGYADVDETLAILAETRRQALVRVDTALVAPEKEDDRVLREWLNLQSIPWTPESRAKFLELLSTPKPEVRKQLVARMPADAAVVEDILWEGMASKYLGTRIVAWQLLRERQPEVKYFDPWASSATREARLNELKNKQGAK